MSRWPCWTYFDRVLAGPPWTRLRVLDFGGGPGNFLRDPGCALPSSQYWCIDVNRQHVTAGRADFPEAHWFFYDRWNPQYNPTGDPSAPLPAWQGLFDLVLAHSVFTHTSCEEMLKSVSSELLPMLAPGGRCVVTLVAPQRLRYFLRRYASLGPEEEANVMAAAAAHPAGFYLLDYKRVAPLSADIRASTQRQSLTSFYAPSCMATLWPEQDVTVVSDGPESQWALIIKPRSIP